MKILFYIIGLLIIFGSNSYAADAATYGKAPKDFNLSKFSKEIKKVEQYLSSFDTLSAKFIQNTDEGVLSEGNIFISRPGKARWEYKAPAKSQLIVNNGRLLFYDVELDQASYDEVPDTPITILLEKEIKFSDRVKVINYYEEGGTITITLIPKENNNIENKFESLTFVLIKNPMTLKRIYRTDANNHTTTLTFNNLKLNHKLDENLFSLASPEFINKKGKN